MKRIIDGMSADQIADGVASGAVNWANATGRVTLLEYLESICKPAPTWEDDVSDDNPVLCWVSNEPIPESGGDPFNRGTDYVFKIAKEGYYMAMRGYRWNYARPISPNECWKPSKQGESNEH